MDGRADFQRLVHVIRRIALCHSKLDIRKAKAKLDQTRAAMPLRLVCHRRNPDITFCDAEP